MSNVIPNRLQQWLRYAPVEYYIRIHRADLVCGGTIARLVPSLWHGYDYIKARELKTGVHNLALYALRVSPPGMPGILDTRPMHVRMLEARRITHWTQPDAEGRRTLELGTAEERREDAAERLAHTKDAKRRRAQANTDALKKLKAANKARRLPT